MLDNAQKIKVLCVDDESELLETLSESLKSIGYEPILAHSKDEAMAQLEAHSSDIMLIIEYLFFQIK